MRGGFLLPWTVQSEELPFLGDFGLSFDNRMPFALDGRGIALAEFTDANKFREVHQMAVNTTLSNSGDAISKAAERGGAALKQGIDVARGGLESAKGALDSAQDQVGDGVDYVIGMMRTVNDMVVRQPLLAVGGAFLIGYIAARLMRRVSSS